MPGTFPPLGELKGAWVSLMNLKLNHIQHIGIPVTNIKVSETFYESLGFKNVMATIFQYKDDTGNVDGETERNDY